MLTPLDFGIVSATLVVITFLATLAQFGACQLIVIAKNEEFRLIAFQSLFLNLCLSVLFSVLVFFFATTISEHLSSTDLSLYIKAMTPIIIIKALTSSFEGALIRDNHFKYIAISSTISFIIGYFAIAMLLILMDFGVWSLILANLTQSLIYCVMLLNKSKPSFRGMTYSLQGLWNNIVRASYISYAQIISNVAGQIDNYFVSKFLGVETLGVYSRAYQLMVVPCNFIGQMINQVFLKEFANESREKTIKIIKYSIILNIVLSSSVVLTLWAYGTNLVIFLLGEQWAIILAPLLLLSVSIYPRILYKIGEPILYSNNKLSNVAIFSTIYLSSIAIFSMMLLQYGILGISTAVLIGTMLYGFSVFIKVINLYPEIKVVFYSSLAVYLLIGTLVLHYV